MVTTANRGPYGNAQLARYSVWPTLGQFYRDDERRRSSSQVDFPGLNERWTDRSGWRWILFFMPATGEFVAQRVDHSQPMAARDARGPVAVLGSIPGFRRRSSYTGHLISMRDNAGDSWDEWYSLNSRLADVIAGDVAALVADFDFMAVLAGRIQVGARLLAALFRDPETDLYDLPLFEIQRRIEAGEIHVAGV